MLHSSHSHFFLTYWKSSLSTGLFLPYFRTLLYQYMHQTLPLCLYVSTRITDSSLALSPCILIFVSLSKPLKKLVHICFLIFLAHKCYFTQSAGLRLQIQKFLLIPHTNLGHLRHSPDLKLSSHSFHYTSASQFYANLSNCYFSVFLWLTHWTVVFPRAQSTSSPYLFLLN